MSSRLFMELREKHALCYQVGTYLTHYHDTGALQIAASCAPDRARELVRRTVAECAKVREHGVTAEELERAKLQLRTSLVLEPGIRQQPHVRPGPPGHPHGPAAQSLDEQIAEMDEVDLDQLHRVARAVLEPEAFGGLGPGHAAATPGSGPGISTAFSGPGAVCAGMAKGS